jgi:hypothetical protein
MPDDEDVQDASEHANRQLSDEYRHNSDLLQLVIAAEAFEELEELLIRQGWGKTITDQLRGSCHAQTVAEQNHHKRHENKGDEPGQRTSADYFCPSPILHLVPLSPLLLRLNGYCIASISLAVFTHL